MKKIKKTLNKRRFDLKLDNLYTEDNISMDNLENKEYLDNFAYQEYLKKESGDFSGEQ